MNSDNIWIDLKTAAQLKDITARALRLALNKSKYISRETSVQGGKTSEILLSSLEKEVQEKYKNIYYKEIIKLEAELLTITRPEPVEQNFIPETAKTIALARLGTD